MSDLSSIVSGGHGSVGPFNRLAGSAIPGAGTGAGSGVYTNGVHKPDRVVEITSGPGLAISPAAATANGAADSVELSSVSRFLERLSSMPDVRFDRVAQIRRDIADGNYETDDKLDIAIERLAKDEML